MEVIIAGCVGVAWFLLGKKFMSGDYVSRGNSGFDIYYPPLAKDGGRRWGTVIKSGSRGNLKILSGYSYVRYFAFVILLLPIFVFRDYTPANELKYISIAEEALKNNNWFAFYNHGEVYADKPPLFFWLIMLSRILTGGCRIWMIGLFSLLPAAGILAIMDKWLKDTGTGHSPAVSNILLITTVLFTGGMLVLRMDMLMTFFIVLSLYTFFNIYRDEHAECEKWLLPVYIFLAVFSKGPMGFIVPVTSIIAFLAVKKQIKTLGRYFGWKQIGILLGLCGAWFLMIYLEGGREYLDNILFKQTIGRGINSFHHKEPLWFYVPRMAWTFAPWTLLYLVLLWRGVRNKTFNTDIKKFFATVVTVNVAVLSLISAKLDIYMLPIYPFAVYLCSILLYESPKALVVKTGIAVPAVMAMLALPVLAAVEKRLPFDMHNILIYIGVAVFSAAGAVSIQMLLKNKLTNAVASIGFGMLSMLFVSSFTLPGFTRYIGFGEMAKAAREAAAAVGVDRYAYYKFPTAQNIDVYLGHELERINSVARLDSLDRLPQKTILFVRYTEIRREDDFKDWLGSREPGWTTGKYSWYMLGNKD